MANQVSPDRIIELGMGFMVSKTVLSAIELGLFTELGSDPMESEALRKKLGLDPRGARDFFESLVALGRLRAPVMQRFDQWSEDGSKLAAAKSF